MSCTMLRQCFNGKLPTGSVAWHMRSSYLIAAGLREFFRGLAPELLKVAPHNATRWSVRSLLELGSELASFFQCIYYPYTFDLARRCVGLTAEKNRPLDM